MTNVEQEDIDSSFLELNNQFAPICVGFEVCETIEIENWQYDSLNDDKWEEMQVLYHQNNRINIFLVQDIGLPEPECGFAERGGIGNLDNNGIVIGKGDCLTWQTLAHEMGHYFGLYHTFEADEFGPELVDDEIDCDTTGDLVCDTAADPYVLGQSSADNMVDVQNGCRFIDTTQDPDGAYYKPDVGNIMSYYPSECICGFTHGQYIRMANICKSFEGSMW